MIRTTSLMLIWAGGEWGTRRDVPEAKVERRAIEESVHRDTLLLHTGPQELEQIWADVDH